MGYQMAATAVTFDVLEGH